MNSESQLNKGSLRTQLYHQNHHPERESHAQLFRIGNAAMHYYVDAKYFQPSPTDRREWLEGVREPLRSQFRSADSRHVKDNWRSSVTLLEKNDSGMTEFMKTHLSPKDFAFYLTATQEGI